MLQIWRALVDSNHRPTAEKKDDSSGAGRALLKTNPPAINVNTLMAYRCGFLED